MNASSAPRPLTVSDLVRRFAVHGNMVTAVDGVSFEVDEGQLYTLLGPSGCGKTTTLRSVAGLERPDGGTIVIDDVVASDAQARTFVPPNKRDAGMVFQSYGIWPHMTVFENAAFPLRVSRQKVRRPEVESRVAEALRTVQLEPYASRMATQLSGGQQQRLALARALVRRPKLLLLDEPLSNLDAKLRESMRAEVASLQRQLGITTLYVTHDQAEALSMSDRIAVMANGRIVQEGDPRTIYQRPADQFVADFVGTTNFVEATVVGVDSGGAHLSTPVGALTVPRTQATAEGASVLIAIRPESVTLHASPPQHQTNVVEGEVTQVMFLGERVDCFVRVGDRQLVSHQGAQVGHAAGNSVWIELPADLMTVVPANDRLAGAAAP